MKRILALSVLILFSALPFDAHGGKTYGRIEIVENGNKHPLPKDVVIKIKMNGSAINHQIREDGWYDVNIPTRGKYTVTCSHKGTNYTGTLISSEGPHRYNIRLKPSDGE